MSNPLVTSRPIAIAPMTALCGGATQQSQRMFAPSEQLQMMLGASWGGGGGKKWKTACFLLGLDARSFRALSGSPLHSRACQGVRSCQHGTGVQAALPFQRGGTRASSSRKKRGRRR